MQRPPRRKDDALINGWVFFRYMVVGVYVGLATVGVFAAWYTRTELFGIDFSGDGHTTVSFDHLASWNGCAANPREYFPDAKAQYTAAGVTYAFEGDVCTSASGGKQRCVCDYFTFDGSGKAKASTLSLTVLVTIEMFNALNALSEDGSLLSMPPWVNPYLLLAMLVSFGLHFVILYIPILAQIFSIVPLTFNDWMVVLAFSAPVMFLDEALKFVGRQMAASERAARLKKKRA